MFKTYYFDIETVPNPEFIDEPYASLEPSKAKIITIQYQPLNTYNGLPTGELTILKEWDKQSSERVILEKFRKIYLENGIWGFIPVGNNLLFECRFMKYKLKEYFNLHRLKLGQKPLLDIKHILILMNNGRFKEYSKPIGKSGKAANMMNWYYNQHFDMIEQYITEEAESFLKAYSILKRELPKIQL